MNSDTQVRDAIAAFDRLFVPLRKTLAAVKSLSELKDLGCGAYEADCLLLAGQAGTGKTMALTYLKHQNRADWTDRGWVRPVAYVQAPPNCTLRSLATTILVELGDIVPSKGNLVEMTDRAVAQLRNQEVRILVIDEVHHLINQETRKVAWDAAEWIKGLLNRNVCPVALSGLPHAKQIIDGNDQLRRRCKGLIEMHPYDWGVEDDRKQFILFLNELDRNSGLAGRSPLARTDIAARIHAFSDGTIGRAKALVRKALHISMVRQLAAIDEDVLADAANALRIMSADPAVNPFGKGGRSSGTSGEKGRVEAAPVRGVSR